MGHALGVAGLPPPRLSPAQGTLSVSLVSGKPARARQRSNPEPAAVVILLAQSALSAALLWRGQSLTYVLTRNAPEDTTVATHSTDGATLHARGPTPALDSPPTLTARGRRELLHRCAGPSKGGLRSRCPRGSCCTLGHFILLTEPATARRLAPLAANSCRCCWRYGALRFSRVRLL